MIPQSWRTNVLFWDLPDDLSTSVRIERQVDGGSFATLTTLGGNEKVYVDTSIYGDTDYGYRVKAINDSGTSSASNTVSVTSFDPADFGNVNDAELLPDAPTVTPVTATTNLVEWTGTFEVGGEVPAGLVFQIERSTDQVLWTPRWAHSVLYGRSFQDTGLTPGTRYYYRVRSYYNAGCSSWSAVGNGIQGSRTPGYPVEPRNLRVTSDTSSTLAVTWTGSGTGTDTYKVDRCDNPEAQPNLRVWNLAHTTAAGVTSWTATGLSEQQGYGFRVRSVNGTGESDNTATEGYSTTADETIAIDSVDYSAWVGYTTGTLTGTYDIGPGQTYESFAAFEASNGGNAMSRLGPGAVVNIHYSTYAEAPMFGGRGTPSSRVTIQGIPDGSGNLPILTGNGAVILNPDPTDGEHPGRQGRGVEYENSAVLFIGKNWTLTPGNFIPGHVIVKNLEFTSAYDGFFASAEDDRPVPWDFAGAGINIAAGDDITVQNCWMNSNGNGLFAHFRGDLRLTSNRFTNNGNATGSNPLAHHVYAECRRLDANYNWFEPSREASGGAGLKLRCVDVRVGPNFIQNTGTPVQVSEPQESAEFAYIFPETRRSYVTGCVLTAVADVGQFNVPPVWYNGDQQNEPMTRAGVLYVSHCTMLARFDDGEERVIYNLGFPTGTIDSRNNVSWAIPDDGSGTILQVLTRIPNYPDEPHCMRFEADFFGPSLTDTRDNAGVLVGELYGSDDIDVSDPELVDDAGLDLHPALGSPLIDAAATLASRVLTDCPASGQYSHPMSVVARTPGDIGAFEYALDPGPLPEAEVPPQPPASSYTFEGPTSGYVDQASTDFTVEPNGDAAGITVTPASDGAGSFTPASVTFTAAESQTFTYTPTSTTGSPHTLSVTDDGGLTDPASIDYTVTNPPAATDRADNFNRADSGTLGTPSDAGSDWSTGGSNCQIAGNKCVGIFGQSVGNATTLETFSTDVDVSCVMDTMWNVPCGPVVRASDSQNYIGLECFNFDTNARIVQVEAGARTVLQTGSVLFTNGDTARIIAIGNEVRAYKNGTLIATATGVTFNNTATQVGISMTSGDPSRNAIDSFSCDATSPAFL